MMSRKNDQVCTALHYIEHFLALSSSVTRCISISDFAFLLGISIGITSSEIGLKICAIAAGIKKYKLIIKKKKKQHDEVVLLAKPKSDSIEVLIPKGLTDSNINHDDYVLINNVLKEYQDMKNKIKNLKTETVHKVLIYL